MERKPPTTAIVITFIILFAVGFVCLCLFLITGGVIFGLGISKTQMALTNPTSTMPPTPRAEIFTTSVPSTELEKAKESLEQLNLTDVPINDPIELADRLGGKKNVPTVLIDQNAPYAAGAVKEFWVSNVDSNVNFQVNAVLRYVGENIYFWIEDGVEYRESALEKLASTFDQQIIPVNRAFFGMEWNPGVDGDPRFYVLYARGLGDSIAGYFSSADELHPEAHPYSNAHEMFLMNADTVNLAQNYIYGTMAHEFQHMIHWYQDRNEETWLNEGFSMLAEHVNHYDSGGFDYDYMLDPDLQLNDWADSPDQNGSHYGASFLFTVYFLDRFGEEATKTLVHEKENGFASIDKVMRDLNLVNPSTGLPYTATEFFVDWSIANYLQNSGIESGRYDYVSYSPYTLNISTALPICPANIARDVYQFGVDYIEIDCPGKHTLSFQGLQTVNLMPFDFPPSGKYFFWSNNGDESNPSLSQTFDLSRVTGNITFNFKTWFDLETDYDYVFLSASTDGQNWRILNSLTCTTDNPSGNSYGCGWNGHSDGWMNESVDLSSFAGQNVTLRFDYVTDAAVNGKGFVLDDFSIDAINYFSDLEQDSGGWQANGFVRIENILPQTYALNLIQTGKTVTIHNIPLDAKNQAEFSFEIGGDVDKVILVVSGTTPITRERAAYRLDVK